MRQSWCDLLFAHWPLPLERLLPLVPTGLALDTYDGQAWLAVAPFTVRDLALRGLPLPPGVNAFPELNVRTYVTVDGRPGIWFFSLDAASIMAVLGARLTYLLPYFPARMASGDDVGWIDYRSERVGGRGRGVRFAGRFRGIGDGFEAAPGSLEHFLVERYCLYSRDRRRGRVYRGEIHHDPWKLQRAEAKISENTMGRPLGFDLGEPALLHFARRQDTVVWPIRRIG